MDPKTYANDLLAAADASEKWFTRGADVEAWAAAFRARAAYLMGAPGREQRRTRGEADRAISVARLHRAARLNLAAGLEVTMHVDIIGRVVPFLDSAMEIPEVVQGADYRMDGFGIWSIGRSDRTGRYYAATDDRYYGKKGYTCEWLR